MNDTKAPQTVVLATQNEGKIAAFSKLLQPINWRVISAKSLNLSLPTELTAPEAGTLEGNARLKACYITEKTGLWALADDSGLFIDALPGQLGVDTATYGGPAKLLEALADAPAAQRGATFRCVLALARPHQPTLLFEAAEQGTIAPQQRGQGGFGYDPVFIIKNQPYTTAERIDREGLATASASGHRGLAVAKLIAWAQG